MTIDGTMECFFFQIGCTMSLAIICNVRLMTKCGAHGDGLIKRLSSFIFSLGIDLKTIPMQRRGKSKPTKSHIITSFIQIWYGVTDNSNGLDE